MNLASITPFIHAVSLTFRELFRLEVKALTPYLSNKDDALDWDISGLIGIAGESRGLVALSFPASLAKELTSYLTGHQKTSLDADVEDTVGEVVNIIAGNAKKGLEAYRLLISLPTVVSGSHHQVRWPTGPVPIITIPFTTERGHFCLSVGLENIVTV